MDKNQLLEELTYKVQSGEISREELQRCLLVTAQSPAEQAGPLASNVGSHHITKALYVVGAAVVVVGICIFVSQIWEDIGSLARIMLTLGIGLLTTFSGTLLHKSNPEQQIGLAFQLIGGLLIPGGAVVTVTEVLNNPATVWPFAWAFGAISLFYLLLVVVHKNPIVTLCAIANGTAFVYLLVAAILDDSLGRSDEVFVYLTMMCGASYLLLGHAFKDTTNEKLVGILYFFGSLGLLGAAFSRVFEYTSWHVLYFILVFGMLALSVYVRSRIILAMTMLFLVIHVSYITSEYFADSIGWPLSLVALGFVFIGLGFASINIHKNYIQQR